MTAKDGGPAFPIYPRITGGGQIQIDDAVGMSLRDWFAGQIISTTYFDPRLEDKTKAARKAYEIADAMLAQREKESP